MQSDLHHDLTFPDTGVLLIPLSAPGHQSLETTFPDSNVTGRRILGTSGPSAILNTPKEGKKEGALLWSRAVHCRPSQVNTHSRHSTGRTSWRKLINDLSMLYRRRSLRRSSLAPRPQLPRTTALCLNPSVVFHVVFLLVVFIVLFPLFPLSSSNNLFI